MGPTQVAGRFVLPLSNGGGLRNAGFLHLRPPDNGTPAAWVITPAWSTYRLASEELPADAEFDSAGIVVDGQLVYRWGSRETRVCTQACVACVPGAHNSPVFRCRFRDDILAIAPGEHNCIVTPADAAMLLPLLKREVAAASAAITNAMLEQQRLELLARRLEELTGTDNGVEG